VARTPPVTVMGSTATTALPVRAIGFKRPKKTGLAALVTRPEAGAILAALIAFVFFSLFAGKFLSSGIIGNIFLLSAELGIVAIGATLLMIAGEFDLSVGSVMGLSSRIAIMLFNAGMPGIPTLILTLTMAAAIGWMNGVLVTKLRMHSLIITIGAMMLYRGIVIRLTGGFPMRLSEQHSILKWFDFNIGVIPGGFLWLLALVVLFAFILNTTKLGNWIFATGGARAPMTHAIKTKKAGAEQWR
jgi:simple sugar transport system permease protein